MRAWVTLNSCTAGMFHSSMGEDLQYQRKWSHLFTYPSTSCILQCFPISSRPHAVGAGLPASWLGQAEGSDAVSLGEGLITLLPLLLGKVNRPLVNKLIVNSHKGISHRQSFKFKFKNVHDGHAHLNSMSPSCSYQLQLFSLLLL